MKSDNERLVIVTVKNVRSLTASVLWLASSTNDAFVCMTFLNTTRAHRPGISRQLGMQVAQLPFAKVGGNVFVNQRGLVPR